MSRRSYTDSHALSYRAGSADWRTRAACRGMDGELFFPNDSDTPGQANAKAICATCPVLDACLLDALDVEDRTGAYSRYGIRGGLTGDERNEQFGKPRAKRPGRQSDAAKAGAT